MKALNSEEVAWNLSRKNLVILRIKGLYEHIPEFEIKEKNAKLIKDEDGRVVTQPKNFYTTGAKKGGGRTVPGYGANYISTLFNKEGFEYIESQYDIEKEIRRK